MINAIFDWLDSNQEDSQSMLFRVRVSRGSIRHKSKDKVSSKAPFTSIDYCFSPHLVLDRQLFHDPSKTQQESNLTQQARVQLLRNRQNRPQETIKMDTFAACKITFSKITFCFRRAHNFPGMH